MTSSTLSIDFISRYYQSQPLDGDAMAEKYFPATSRFNAEQFSTEPLWRPNLNGTSQIQSPRSRPWRPEPTRSSYDPTRYGGRTRTYGSMTPGDVVDLGKPLGKILGFSILTYFFF